MFVICRKGHLGFWWEGDTPIFVEEGGGIFPSRSECLLHKENVRSFVAGRFLFINAVAYPQMLEAGEEVGADEHVEFL